MALTDNSPMPFGKYKGTAMTNVPASYLLWLYDNGKCGPDINTYVLNNMDVIKVQIEREKAQNRYNCK